MAIRKGPPAVQLAITNTLLAGVNAEIAAVNSAWSDNVTLPTTGNTSPTPNLQIINGYREVIPEYPALVVSYVDTSVAADAASMWQNLMHRFEISVICQDLDVANLDKQIQRYLVAIWETLLKSPQLDGSLSGLIGLGLTKAGRSDVWQKDKVSTMLMQAAAWYCLVEMDESA